MTMQTTIFDWDKPEFAESDVTACDLWQIREMTNVCHGQIKMTNAGRYDLRNTPYTYEFCQFSAMADCMIRH